MASKSPINGNPGRLRRLLHSFGLVALGLSAGRAPAVAQSTDFKAASEAPAAWRDYASRLQGAFQHQIEGDGDMSQWLVTFAAGREKDNKPLTFVVSASILPDGRMDRIAFDSSMDPELGGRLRPLLAAANAGAPPPDMLQPLRLRLRLRSTE
ncbi:hypothetical protein AAFX91_30570 [Bradyrhizobium sp. 31Argb]|uniref:hypothetical protein n=1 Tax=Bradyrhizobium sp. 31Argb TaxID=3141247 RepID=UPI003748C782